METKEYEMKKTIIIIHNAFERLTKLLYQMGLIGEY